MTVGRLRRALALSRPDPLVHSMLADALAALEAGQPVAEAMSLAGPRAVKERNRLIAIAAEELEPGAGPWRQAKAVQQGVAVARLTIDRSAASIALRDAALCGRIPETQRALFEILKTEKSARQFQLSARSCGEDSCMNTGADR